MLPRLIHARREHARANRGQNTRSYAQTAARPRFPYTRFDDVRRPAFYGLLDQAPRTSAKGGNAQSIGVIPAWRKNSLARENGRLPKNP